MPYLSELLGSRVVGPSGRRLGRIREVLARGDVFPSVTAVEVGADRVRIDWADVTSEHGVFTARTADPAGASASAADADGGALLLARDVLDRQIIDARGLKVVRVNDVTLAEFGPELRVVGVDVGMRSFLRRLGVEPVVSRLADALGYALEDVVIPWSYVASLEGFAGVRLGVERELLARLRPAEMAEILDALSPEDRLRFLGVADDRTLAASLWEATPGVQAQTLSQVGDGRAAHVLDMMPPDEAADVIGRLPTHTAERLLVAMSAHQGSVVRRLLGYHPRSAGGLMTPDFVVVRQDDSARDCIAVLRQQAPAAESIYYIYAADDAGRLAGVVPLRELLTADSSASIGAFVRTGVASVRVDATDEDVAETMERYDLLAIPVVEDDDRLVGIITVDDVMRHLSERSSQDLAALTGAEEGMGTAELAPGRVGALIASICVGLLAAMVLAVSSRPAGPWVVLGMIPVMVRLGQEQGGWGITSFVERHGRAGATAASDVAAGAIASVPVAVAVGAGMALQIGARHGAVMAGSVLLAAGGATALGVLLPRLLARAGEDWLQRYGRIVPLASALAGLALYLALAALAPA